MTNVSGWFEGTRTSDEELLSIRVDEEGNSEGTVATEQLAAALVLLHVVSHESLTDLSYPPLPHLGPSETRSGLLLSAALFSPRTHTMCKRTSHHYVPHYRKIISLKNNNNTQPGPHRLWRAYNTPDPVQHRADDKTREAECEGKDSGLGQQKVPKSSLLCWCFFALMSNAGHTPASM